MNFQKPLGAILAAFVVFWPSLVRSVTLDFPQDGSRLELITETAPEPGLEVRPLKGSPLMGRTEHQPGRLVFVPALPFISGQSYVAEWTEKSGKRQKAEFKIHPPKSKSPTVRLEPTGTALPANALKIYLHFSEPMEQGVFLDRLRLLDAKNQEVIGPFRETELWSPDGKRLTVWFHPGRQKAGVNLNLEEGPVLHPKSAYTLVVSGIWRSVAGVPIGQDQSLEFTTTDADHECPQMRQWQLTTPPSGTREPLRLQFNEGLDPAMLKAALHVRTFGAATAVAGEVSAAPSGTAWTFTPHEPWTKGDHELTSDPNLEDLAGNSLIKLFEVDASSPAREAGITAMKFRVK